MRGIWAIFHREFLGYFRSPIAYVFLIGFILFGVGLPWFLDNFLDSDEASLQAFFPIFAVGECPLCARGRHEALV